MTGNRLSARKRARFLDVLAETGNVAEAARQAALNRQHLYALRRDDGAFAMAWEAALDEAADALLLEARRRALEGVEQPVFHKGGQVGTRRVYSDRLLVFLLQAHGHGPAGLRGGRAAGRPEPEPEPEAGAVPDDAFVQCYRLDPEAIRTGEGQPIFYEEEWGCDPQDGRVLLLGLRASMPFRLRPLWEESTRNRLAMFDGFRARGESDWAHPSWPEPDWRPR